MGTILGPTLLNTFINNTVQFVNNKMNLYADDQPCKNSQRENLITS